MTLDYCVRQIENYKKIFIGRVGQIRDTRLLLKVMIEGIENAVKNKNELSKSTYLYVLSNNGEFIYSLQNELKEHKKELKHIKEHIRALQGKLKELDDCKNLRDLLWVDKINYDTNN